MTTIHQKAAIKCTACGKTPLVDPAWPLEAVAVPSDEPGADDLLDVRAVHREHGIASSGMVWTFGELDAEVAAAATDHPVAVITDADASLIVDADGTARDVLDAAAAVWRHAREAERLAAAAARTAIRYAAAAGMSESEVARATGIARLTVRAALGKQDR